jgi:hypothetical protein
VDGDVVFERAPSTVRPPRPGRIDTQGKHRRPQAERNKFGSDRRSTQQVGSHVDLGLKVTRSLSARLQQNLTWRLTRFSTEAVGCHHLDVNDQQRRLAQSRFHRCPQNGLSRCARAVNSYADDTLGESIGPVVTSCDLAGAGFPVFHHGSFKCGD